MELNQLDASGREASSGYGQRCGPIDFGACRIVVYGKPGSHGSPLDSVVAEADLAERLLTDFADRVGGLLPSLVLAALAAVRDNVHRVLERFGRDLDPAFLAHRACLPQPSDSGHHIVEQIGSELRGIMEDVVADTSAAAGATPAGIEAIKLWLDAQFGDDPVVFGEKKVCQRIVLEMLEHGVEKKHGPLKARGREFHILSDGFLGSGQGDARKLDRRLASAMSFRQVFADTPRELSLGTVVIGDNDELLLCVTPKCDSVRLTQESSFLFLPLVDRKSNTLQVVVPMDGNEYQRRTISTKPSTWSMRDFKPHPVNRCVLAHGTGCSNWAFAFRDVDDRKYRWVGELKPEFAQSIAQAIAGRMSRLPLNKSEWLRRAENR